MGTWQKPSHRNTFIEAIDNDIENLLTKRTTFPKSNLSIQENEALKEVSNRDNLIIKNADKGGATVIQDIDSYIQEATNFYKKITVNSIATKVIIKFLSLILTLDNFIFNSIHYLQIKGCAIIICEHFYGKVWIDTYLSIHQRENKNVLLRYMDDLFFIWKGTAEELLLFIEVLNKKHLSIKFNFKYSKTEIEFSRH